MARSVWARQKNVLKFGNKSVQTRRPTRFVHQKRTLCFTFSPHPPPSVTSIYPLIWPTRFSSLTPSPLRPTISPFPFDPLSSLDQILALPAAEWDLSRNSPFSIYLAKSGGFRSWFFTVLMSRGFDMGGFWFWRYI